MRMMGSNHCRIVRPSFLNISGASWSICQTISLSLSSKGKQFARFRVKPKLCRKHPFGFKYTAALRLYFSGKEKKLNRLAEYAMKLGVMDKLTPYLEVLV